MISFISLQYYSYNKNLDPARFEASDIRIQYPAEKSISVHPYSELHQNVAVIWCSPSAQSTIKVVLFNDRHFCNGVVDSWCQHSVSTFVTWHLSVLVRCSCLAATSTTDIFVMVLSTVDVGTVCLRSWRDTCRSLCAAHVWRRHQRQTFL